MCWRGFIPNVKNAISGYVTGRKSCSENKKKWQQFVLVKKKFCTKRHGLSLILNVYLLKVTDLVGSNAD